MNGAGTKLLITLGKIVIAIYRSRHGAEPNFRSYKFKRKKPVVFASHPHMVGPARRSSGNACGVAFSLTIGIAVEQTDYRQTPTPPIALWLRKPE